MSVSSWTPVVVPGGMGAMPPPGRAGADVRPRSAGRQGVPVRAGGPCFVAGTRIAVPGGTAPVESLRPGDAVLTLLGEARAVVSAGRCELAGARPGAAAGPAVRIAAHAFGHGMPERDLLLAPGHAVYVEGVLVPAAVLVDGGTVRREAGAERVRYVHLALGTHDVVLAEDMPVESCLGRLAAPVFLAQGEGIVVLHPRFAAMGVVRQEGGPGLREQRCAPLVRSGAVLARVRARLARQAARMGV